MEVFGDCRPVKRSNIWAYFRRGTSVTFKGILRDHVYVVVLSMVRVEHATRTTLITISIDGYPRGNGIIRVGKTTKLHSS